MAVKKSCKLDLCIFPDSRLFHRDGYNLLLPEPGQINFNARTESK